MNKNITLAVDEDELKSARVFASKQDTTINQLVRDYICHLARMEFDIVDWRGRAKDMLAKSQLEFPENYRFNREEMYEERMFPRHEHTSVRGVKKAK